MPRLRTVIVSLLVLFVCLASTPAALAASRQDNLGPYNLTILEGGEDFHENSLPTLHRWPTAAHGP